MSSPTSVSRSARSPAIFLSAGEPSGDLHGSALARAIRARIPEARLIGLGGPKMAAEGVELLANLDDLAVMGFVEVASRLPFFLDLRKRVFRSLREADVRLVVPIDYPGFNLRLARRARAEGRRVLYYIAPQVWAWHASRAKDLARDADRIAVILPFEEEFLRANGGDVEFVGHPLLDAPFSWPDREEWFRSRKLDATRPLLAVMPGSRVQEVRRHLAAFSAAASIVQARRPEVQVMIGAPETIPAGVYSRSDYPLTQESQELLHFASAALVKSGTTTLEAALAGTPFVVAYRMNPLSFQLAKKVVRVPHIALANLVAERRLVREFVQGEASPENLAGAILPLLEGGEERERTIAGLGEVRAKLGRGGAADRVADMATELLQV